MGRQSPPSRGENGRSNNDDHDDFIAGWIVVPALGQTVAIGGRQSPPKEQHEQR